MAAVEKIDSVRPSVAQAGRRQGVLVVDDEPTIGEIVARYLERAGFRADVARDGPQALALVARLKPDLVVLDVMLPGMDGLEVMRIVQQQERRPAVILLTARTGEADRITGLRRGADDYVVKPFSPAELVARVQAVLRRGASPVTGGTLVRAGEIEISESARTASIEGREVQLTPREFDLLLFLASHPGQVFSRDALMDRVWDCGHYSDSSTVTVHIRRLRAKLEREPERPRHIQTVWGVGYRFVA